MGVLYDAVTKPIGVYTISNTMAVLVYTIQGDRVLISANSSPPEWANITENEDEEPGFCIGSFFIPFSEVMRI